MKREVVGRQRNKADHGAAVVDFIGSLIFEGNVVGRRGRRPSDSGLNLVYPVETVWKLIVFGVDYGVEFSCNGVE